MKPTVAIGGDHAGFSLKKEIVGWLEHNGFTFKDFGPWTEESVDYPDFAHQVASAVEKKEFDFGILVCGSGNGVAMAANKHQGIRAALCWLEELGVLARQHNDANVLCLAGRFISTDLGLRIVQAFLTTTFEGGRHARRVGKISC
jgi:ribose 5-phosphate isomerase B